MRVVIIADFAEASGGAQSVALQSAVALRASGVHVTYVHGVDAPCDERLAHAGVQRLGLGLRDVWDRSALAGAASGIWNREAASRLRSALASLPTGPTILHLHQWTRSLSPAVLSVLLKAGHPLVVTLHDYFIACPNGVYYRFDRGEPCSLAPLSPACIVAPCDPRSMAHKAVRVLRAFATRAATAGTSFDLVHVSDRGRDTVSPFLPSGLAQHRVDNPVDVEMAPPASPAAEGAIAFIGRLTREKGADLVAAAGQATGTPVMFIGEGPAESEIRALNPEAEILGWRSRAEVDQLLRARIRAVAAPSRWYETGPLTIYEAMAAGIPVVASTRSGAAEKVVHGETGLVVEPAVDPLAAAFSALADGDAAKRMGARAYARYWAAPLGPDAHAERLIELYGQILGRRSAPLVLSPA